MFSKLLMVPIALLRRMNIRLVIYLDDIFLMGRTLEEILMSGDINFSASTSAFCHESEKISSETITANRVSRPKNRYPHHDFGNNRGKDEKDNFEMS